jgi:hypothetical protein
MEPSHTVEIRLPARLQLRAPDEQRTEPARFDETREHANSGGMTRTATCL